MKGEPSLEEIDDFNGNESKEKKNTVRLVVIFLLIFGAVLWYLQQPQQKEIQLIEEKTGIPAR